MVGNDPVDSLSLSNHQPTRQTYAQDLQGEEMVKQHKASTETYWNGEQRKRDISASWDWLLPP